ncbi:MAG: serine/threonine protein kinase [Phylliscum demangeonii]|nr:MAG: serine/threonine protein kinase [Phylliscum demangeonii]
MRPKPESDLPTNDKDATGELEVPTPVVHFSAVNQEIEPAETILLNAPSTPPSEAISPQELNPDAQDALLKLSQSLQRHRTGNFAFEPLSLPASRTSAPQQAPTSFPVGQNAVMEDQPLPSPLASDPSSGRSTLTSDASDEPFANKHHVKFTVGPNPSMASLSPSPEATRTSGDGYSGSATSFARPFAPMGEKDDPYARSKRPSPPVGTVNIDPRFVFGGKDSKRYHAQSTPNLAGQVPRSNSSVSDLKTQSDKRHSLFKRDHSSRALDESAATGTNKTGSMSDLKRFFGLGHRGKRAQSPALASRNPIRSGYRTPPHTPPSSVPFGDDHGLVTKYGQFGKVLGSGAGGSVRLMKRSHDGVTFAVKEFRTRHAHETEKDYAKKVTAEFCVGSTLHHGNIIEALDIVLERGRWYEVMEYAPYDLFATVMTGKMSREEVTCSFLQVFAGVTYLHSMGLAHRDIKLDNVVVNERGIMKIIDFGSAAVFRYPFENDVVLAQGIVGSDPYLAPEVYDNNVYDPQPADIWSLAIVFCCMSLRRFPWKVPRLTDYSFSLFASPPLADDGSSARGLTDRRPKSTPDLPPVVKKAESSCPPLSPPTSQEPSDAAEAGAPKPHRPHHAGGERSMSGGLEDAGPGASAPSAPASNVIRGPWRLLRLLPRESRHIMSRMLEIDPRHRATLDEMLADPWVASSPVCRQEEGGRVVLARGHSHTLEPATAPPDK